MIKQTAKSAFTLIELLIVIAILGSLAAFVVIRFTGAQSQALDTKRKSEVKQYQNALEIYATKNGGNYVTQTSTVTAYSVCATLGLSSCTHDPKISSGWPDYNYQSSAGGLNYVIWSKLEKTNDFFVVCSNGQTGSMPTNWTGPVSGACPL